MFADNSSISTFLYPFVNIFILHQCVFIAFFRVIRFDFSFNRAMKADELERVEASVNLIIQ